MKCRGFSLIELLITLVIISILAAVIYPSYTAHILKTRRVQAKVALLDLAAKLESYYVTYDSYKDVTFAKLNSKDHLEFYQLQMQTGVNTYHLAAIPLGPQAKDPCGNLIYNQTGEKKISGKLPLLDCW
jgi:type IV pilus assembly protein PilE